MQSLDQLFTEEESILTRRVSGASGLACERAEAERAYDATPQGIAEAQDRADRWAARAETDDDTDPNEPVDDDDYDDIEEDEDDDEPEYDPDYDEPDRDGDY
jgi:hypothetical protein